MGIIYGLGAALCWGVGDFAITKLARYVGSARSLLYIQIFSLLSWLALIPVFPHVLTGGTSIWAIAFIAGLFHVVGLATTYRAFEIGTLSFVSPIASSFAIVTALMFVVTKNSPGLMSLLGIVLLVGGIIVVTRSYGQGEKTTIRGVPEAIASAVCFGVMFWIMKVYVRPLGDVAPLVLLKIMATIFAAGYAARSKPGLTERVPGKWKLIGIAVIAALLDTMAWVSYLFGFKHDHGAVVTALASLFSVVTIVLAGVFLRERLSRLQWVGVAIVLTGILLVSLQPETEPVKPPTNTSGSGGLS